MRPRVSLRLRLSAEGGGGDLNMSGNRLSFLPESFGALEVCGKLDLEDNRLSSLPDWFGTMRVGGDVSLESNQLSGLPESLESICVGGGLNLRYNCLGDASKHWVKRTKFHKVRGFVEA
eukprot:TRINITY_DN7964_c0_g3_i3.p1 TRINITY_DN7964_c0_g3~~TRINITY_DN7964_c0_g3_i3.p1  ORF type:complete len:119 (-),score=23.42 TRINITY_DN7964_c0_g3_i3:623-979(-)